MAASARSILVGDLDFSDNKAFGSLGETHQDILARQQIIHTRSAQGFDMDEDVAGFSLADDEAVPLGAIEPFDLGLLQGTRP